MVEDARRALRGGAGLAHAARARAGALLRLARRVEEEADALADLETRDTGKPLKQAQADVARDASATSTTTRARSSAWRAATIPLGPDALDYTVREPWGVCGQVIPWNYPLQVATRCAAPALAAGNAVILKPSELASITPLRLAAVRRGRRACRGG